MTDVNMMSSSSSDGDGTIIDPKESRIKNRGKSDIETLARTIDDRLQNRLRVSLWERKKFLDICFEIAKKEEESRNGSLSRFSKEGLVILVEELKGRVAQKPRASRLYDELLKLIGYYDPDKSMLRLFEAGLRYTENSDEDEFYFRDFNFYCTVIASKYGLMRIPGLTIMFSLVAFYFGSAVLFCAIMNDQNVCPSYGNNSSHHDGWLTTIYFASVTMSTVGYRDVSLYEYGQPKWITCIAIVYMLVAMAVALSVFAKVAEMAMNGIGLYKVHMFSRMKTQIMESKDMPLYKQIR